MILLRLLLIFLQLLKLTCSYDKGLGRKNRMNCLQISKNYACRKKTLTKANDDLAVYVAKKQLEFLKRVGYSLSMFNSY